MKVITQVNSLRDFSLPPTVRKHLCLSASFAACGGKARTQTQMTSRRGRREVLSS